MILETFVIPFQHHLEYLLLEEDKALGMEYVEIGLTEHEKRYKEIMIVNLQKKAKMLGFQIVA